MGFNSVFKGLKNNIKIYIKTSLTRFSAVTPSPGSTLIRAY